jgi:hypothetical protein
LHLLDQFVPFFTRLVSSDSFALPLSLGHSYADSPMRLDRCVVQLTPSLIHFA